MLVKKAYYINLDYRKNKNQFMEGQLGPCGIDFSRVSGVDVEDFQEFSIEPTIAHGSLRHKGTMGCFFAHRNCIKKIVEENNSSQDYYAVLEDDVSLNCEVFSELGALVPPEGLDLLSVNSAMQLRPRLGAWKRSPNKPYPEDKYRVSDSIYKIYTVYPIFLGAFFYVVNLNVAKKILNKMEAVQTYEDYDMFLFKNFNCYTYITEKVYVENFKSDRDLDAKYNIGRMEG